MRILEESMHKTPVYVSLLLLAVIIGSGSARGDAVQLTLGSTTGTNIVTFINQTSPGHHFDLMLGPCSGTSCALASPANSYFSINGIPSSNFGAYSLSTTLAAADQFPTLTQGSPGSGVFACSTTCGSTQFSISFPSGGMFGAGS